jgi:hypothetical protein
MNIRLEYSSITGQFNCANALDKIDTENGYRIIACLMDNDRANRFIGSIHQVYPHMKMPGSGGCYAPVEKVKIELLQFIKEDLLSLEKEMDKTFVRRTS